MLRQVLLVLALSVGCAFFAACGSSSTSSIASACSLLSLDTLSSLTGLTFDEGEPDNTEVDSGCVWSTEDRQGEVSVLVGQSKSADEFDGRVIDGEKSFGSETPIEIAGATKSVEFSEFGLVVMAVNGQLLQVHEFLPQITSVHRELAAAIARSAA